MNKSTKPSLAQTHPELAKQADGWDPSTVTSQSGKKTSWKCIYGHTWIARPADRSKGTGCPICIGKIILVGFNDLATTHPLLAQQADGWDATSVTSGSSARKKWRCDHGHFWESTVSNRSRGSNCPYCSGRQTIQGVNDLATTHPELAAQAHGWDPRTLKAHSNKKVLWRGSCHHLWITAVTKRTQGDNCPYCSGQKLLVGFNDLATTHPELAAQADGWDPTTVSFGSNKPQRWKCSFEHHWTIKTNHRSNGSNCPFCSGQKLLVGFNDLATTHPELAAEADGWDPTIVGKSSESKRLWMGSCKHQWIAKIKDRAAGAACPFCSGQKVLAGFNDLKTTDPLLAAQADGWDPTKFSRSSNKSFLWLGECGHKWKSSITNRTRGSGCSYCAGKSVLVGFNDLETINPELAAEANGWDPSSVTAHSGRKVSWKCPEGHTWKSQISNRALGKGCPSCAVHGFKPKDKAWLYLLESEELELLQLGITNNPEERLAKHKRSGFGIVRDLRGPIDGYLARDLERSCIQSLVKRGAIFANNLTVKQFDGWTESWSTKSSAPTNFSELLEWVYSDEADTKQNS
jgi:hypothetical protein